PLLLWNPEPRLEPDQIPHLSSLVLAPELDHGVRLAPGPRISESDRLHRSEPQRLPAPAGHLLHRKATLEVGNGVEIVTVVLVCLEQSVDEGIVLRGIQRRVQVVVTLAFAVARQ